MPYSLMGFASFAGVCSPAYASFRMMVPFG